MDIKEFDVKLSLPPNKSFKQDISAFYDKLLTKENFSFSKYADGEWAVIRNCPVNNGEFWFDPTNAEDQKKRKYLIESFEYKNPQYYVGISCPCCQGDEIFEMMKEQSLQDDEHLTWANLFVNSNYQYYLNKIMSVYQNRKIVLYCHASSTLDYLPFRAERVFRIGRNAWNINWDMIEESKHFITSNKIKDHVFLFCCGPFGNILCHQLTRFCSDNTYLDIGSTLNPFLQSSGFDRHYYMGDNIFSRLTCSWGK
jgi:hypothetical protein